MVSIILVNHNGKEHILECLRSFYAHAPIDPFEVIVVDNNSSDGCIELVQRDFPSVKLLTQEKNEGFGKANNIGAHASIGEYLFFLNNDTIFLEDVVTPLRRFLDENASCGAVGPLLLNPDQTYQHSHGYFPSLINEWKVQKDTRRIKAIPPILSYQRVDWISFAAVMIPRKAFEKISGFDERYFMYFEDADVCMRLALKGFMTMYDPRCRLIHLGGASWSRNNTGALRLEYRRSQLLYYSQYRSARELFLLRLYLLVKHSIIYLTKCGQERRTSALILHLVLHYHAHSS